jgi:hypothetical protein
MTARQPGEAAKGAKVSPENGDDVATTAQSTAAFLDLPSALHAHGEIHWAKRQLQRNLQPNRQGVAF